MVLPGFNTDFTYRGQVYHAQTEDNGLNNPVVVTLLYLKGAILASKKTSYAHLLGKADFHSDLLEMMKAQHRELMSEVLAGRHGAPGAAPPPAAEPAFDAGGGATAATPPPEETGSLDEAIMNFLDSRPAGSQR